MKAKLPIKTDWVTLPEAVKLLSNMGVKRVRTTIYSHARTGKIKSKSIPKGTTKQQYLVYVPSLQEYAEEILENKSNGGS